jgi:N-dimethylarginine dimethylaminohydrolase
MQIELRSPSTQTKSAKAVLEASRPTAPREKSHVDEFPSNVGQLEIPSFLMCLPLSYSTVEPNNAWMTDLSSDDREIAPSKAMRQFQSLYQFVASRAIVQLLPIPASCKLQDLVFVANLGLVLEHLPEKDTVILSNFRSLPREGETEVGLKFFQSMGYKTYVPKTKFEGEAELKHLRDNIYIGGYGLRSDRETFEQLEEHFGMKIIKVKETDEHLYHLDCSIFPLTKEKTVVCTEMFSESELAELERHTEIIPVTRLEALPGLCNSVRLGNVILNGSHIHSLARQSNDYALELGKNRKLEDIATANGFELAFFNLSEYQKGGAALSCMMMHMNRSSYHHRLL